MILQWLVADLHWGPPFWPKNLIKIHFDHLLSTCIIPAGWWQLKSNRTGRVVLYRLVTASYYSWLIVAELVERFSCLPCYAKSHFHCSWITKIFVGALCAPAFIHQCTCISLLVGPLFFSILDPPLIKCMGVSCSYSITSLSHYALLIVDLYFITGIIHDNLCYISLHYSLNSPLLQG